MKDIVRFAMIGCGRRAPAYPRTMKVVKNAKIVALCDFVAPLVKEIKKIAEDDTIREYTDYRKMLDDGGFDAVIVCTEPEYQVKLSIDVMEAGYHVLSEVPVGYSLEDCWKLVVATERTKKIYYLGEQIRHTPLMKYWKELVQTGVLGSIIFAEGHYIHAMSCYRFWRHTETGKLLTWEEASKTDKKVKTRQWTLKHPILYGPHELSPLLKVIDDRVVSVSCYSSGSPNRRMKEIPFPGQFEEFPDPDIEVALMRTEKGTIIRFAASFTTPVSIPHWYHLLGTKGEVETARGKDEPGYSYFYPVPVMEEGIQHIPRTKESWFHFYGVPPEDIKERIEKDIPEEARTTGHGGADFYPVFDFVNCLLKGTKPDIDVYKAVETAAPCILAAMSAEKGGERFIVPDFRPNEKRPAGEMPERIL